MKICEKDRKDHIFINVRMFPFHGNIMFSELFFKRKCKKAASFRKCVFLRKYEIFVQQCVKMKFSMSFCYENKRFFTCVQVNFSLTIFKRKDEICYVVLQLKQVIGQLFVDGVYIFLLIFCRKRDQRVADLFFFSFMEVNADSL